ncbi:MAG: hypothetical protein KGN34_06850 [Sphingomonadales bacterium]|nr:hypothetical protein [Sphingomonadales bacterium]
MIRRCAAVSAGILVNLLLIAIMAWLQGEAVVYWSHWEWLGHDQFLGSIADAGTFLVALVAGGLTVARLSRLTKLSLSLLALSSLLVLLLIVSTPGDPSQDHLVVRSFWNGMAGTVGGVLVTIWLWSQKLKQPQHADSQGNRAL